MDCKYYKEESGLSASALHPSPEGLGFPRGIDKVSGITPSTCDILDIVNLLKMGGSNGQ
jgi:hypothetical protein